MDVMAESITFHSHVREIQEILSDEVPAHLVVRIWRAYECVNDEWQGMVILRTHQPDQDAAIVTLGHYAGNEDRVQRLSNPRGLRAEDIAIFFELGNLTTHTSGWSNEDVPMPPAPEPATVTTNEEDYSASDDNDSAT